MPPHQHSRDSDHGFAGVALTFARVPMAVAPEDLAGADVAILGAPFDLAVTYRPGTRFGPRAVRQAEDVGVDRRVSIELGIDPYEELNVVDYGDAAAPASDILGAHRSIQERVGEILAAGAIPAVIGGDHSITLPILRALAAHHGAENFSVIHFDTHADTGVPRIPSRTTASRSRARSTRACCSAATSCRSACAAAGRSPRTSTACAGRASAGTRWARSTTAASGPCSTTRSPTPASAPRVRISRSTSIRMDPAYAPGTGTPEPGGLTSRELLGAVRRIACEVDLCGIDLVEVSPPYDVADITALAGQRVIQEALGGIALRRSGKPAKPARH